MLTISVTPSGSIRTKRPRVRITLNACLYVHVSQYKTQIESRKKNKRRERVRREGRKKIEGEK
jgi:hypothetical protein